MNIKCDLTCIRCSQSNLNGRLNQTTVIGKKKMKFAVPVETETKPITKTIHRWKKNGSRI